MKCKKCNNNINSNENFCINCGNKTKNNNKRNNFTIIRTIIITLYLTIPLIILNNTSSDSIIMISFISTIILYIISSLILNKYIFFKEYSNYIFSNFFSLLAYIFISIFIWRIYFDLASWNNSDRGYASLFIIIYNICTIPISFIFNIVMDLIITKINNKKSS